MALDVSTDGEETRPHREGLPGGWYPGRTEGTVLASQSGGQTCEMFPQFPAGAFVSLFALVLRPDVM